MDVIYSSDDVNGRDQPFSLPCTHLVEHSAERVFRAYPSRVTHGWIQEETCRYRDTHPSLLSAVCTRRHAGRATAQSTGVRTIDLIGTHAVRSEPVHFDLVRFEIKGLLTVAELEKNSWAGHSKKKRENFVLKCTLDVSFSFTFNSRSSALCILEIKGNTVQVLQT
jgi:hypothetical protein